MLKVKGLWTSKVLVLQFLFYSLILGYLVMVKGDNWGLGLDLELMIRVYCLGSWIMVLGFAFGVKFWVCVYVKLKGYC